MRFEGDNAVTKVYCDSCGKWLTVWYEVYIRIDAEHPNINVAKMRLNAGRKHLCQGCMDDIKKALDEKRGHKGEVGDR